MVVTVILLTASVASTVVRLPDDIDAKLDEKINDRDYKKPYIAKGFELEFKAKRSKDRFALMPNNNSKSQAHTQWAQQKNFSSLNKTPDPFYDNTSNAFGLSVTSPLNFD